MVTGTNISSSRRAVALCSKYSGYLSSTAGIHPHHAENPKPGWINEIEEIASSQCVVAIGETGLDYFRDFSPRSDQRKVFCTQLELAAKLGLPVFIHDRDSDGDLLQIVSECRELKAVVHCFTGSQDLLLKYLELNLYIGITGWICDERRGIPLRDIVHLIPNDRLLVETDSPYLLPRSIQPRPRTRRNEPANLQYVVDEIASARNQSPPEVAQLTSDNAKRLFAIN